MVEYTLEFVRRSGKRLLIIVFGGIILLSLYLIVSHYYQTISMAEEQELRRLEGIVNTLAPHIDGSVHKKLLSSFGTEDAITATDEDSQYAALHAVLRTAYLENRLNSDMYTLVRESSNQGDTTFLFGVTSGIEPYFRHRYNTPPQELRNSFETGNTIPAYRDEHGTWLSAYAPIKDDNGEVVAIVQADTKFDEFIASARARLIDNIIFSLAILFFVLGVVYLLIKGMLKNDREKNAEILHALDELRSLNIELNVAKSHLEEKVKERTEELETSNTELKRTNLELDTFIYRATHDLRNPLCSTSELINFVREEHSEKERFRLLDMMKNSVSKLDTILCDLVDYTNNSRKELDFEKINFLQLINETLEEARLNKDFLKLDVKVNVEQIAVFSSDPQRIKVLLKNLISNAITFQAPGNAEPGFIDIEIQSDFTQALIKISNSGEEISGKKQKRVFEMFYRGSVKSRGSGLGLYLVQEIVRKLGGIVSLTSSAQVTTFTIALPNKLTGQKENLTSIAAAA